MHTCTCGGHGNSPCNASGFSEMMAITSMLSLMLVSLLLLLLLLLLYYCLCLAGEDYVAESGSGTEQVIFNPGSTEFTYTVTLVSDNVFEGGDELLTVGLRATGAGGVVISQARFTLTIIEDDSRSHDMSHDTF